MKIYELTGLPGSGKSYLVENSILGNIEFIDEKNFYNICKKISFKNKIKKLLFFLIFYFDVVIYLYIFSIKMCKSVKVALKTVNDLIKYIALYENVVNMNKNKEKIVFDQGIIQNIWSISLLNKKKLEKNHLLKHIFSRFEKRYNMVCVYYIVDYKIAAKRAISREKKSFTDYLEYDDLCELYDNHYNDYRVFCNYLNKSNIEIITNEKELNKVLES